MELTRRQVLAATAATPVSLMLKNVARAAGGSVAGLAAEPSGSNPADLTVVELLPLLASRGLSAAELVEACIARVERFDPEIKAFQHRTFERALAGARAADEARALRRPVGPLAGIPIGLKDMTYTTGVPTTGSSKVLEDFVPDRDATVWARLQDAGMVLSGSSPATSSPTAPTARRPSIPGTLSAAPAAAREGRRQRSPPACFRRHRHRHGGVYHLPVGHVRHDRHQADLWPELPPRQPLPVVVL